MQPLRVAAGTRIFSAGQPSEAVYVIADGEVAITVNDGVEVARLAAGALFGESGVLEGRARAATATATMPTHLLVTDADTFMQAFGMDNEQALTLVKLLCQRLRSTTLRAAEHLQAATPALPYAAVHMMPDDERLCADHGLAALTEIRLLPFQVGNRYGGETVPITSNHSCCIAARGSLDLGAPHFEILRRDGRLGVHDLGTPHGTLVNGTRLHKSSLTVFAPLRRGDNLVVAGRAESMFRFRLRVLEDQAQR